MVNFDTLILSGGGIKGIGQLGAIYYYQTRLKLDLSNVNLLAGTSIGSVICLLLLCGYKPLEILNDISGITNFLNTKGSVISFANFHTSFGMMDISSIEKIIRALVMKKLNHIPTMSQLFMSTKKKFVITAVNLSKMKLEYFDHITQPSLSVVDAVIMSCNLPLIFKKIEYKGDCYVDGGLSNNFPIDVVHDLDKRNVLGIVTTGIDTSTGPLGFLSYLSRTMQMPISATTKSQIKNIHKNVTLITINYDDAQIIDFSMDDGKREAMFKKGFREAKREDERLDIEIEGWPPIEDEDKKVGWDLTFEI